MMLLLLSMAQSTGLPTTLAPKAKADSRIECAHAEFGRASLGALGDVDGDGVQELLLADLGSRDPDCRPMVWLIDGAVGQALYRVELPSGSRGMSMGLRRLGDQDGDGISEWALLEASGVTGSVQFVFHGKSGAWLRERVVPDAPVGSRFLAVLGDLDGDGAPDALLEAGGQEDGRRLEIRSLREGKVQASFELPRGLLSHIDHAVGLPDSGLVLLAGAGPLNRSQRLLALRWQTGEQSFDFLESESSYCAGLYPLPDLDGDGRQDFAWANLGMLSARATRDGRILEVFAVFPDERDGFGRTMLWQRGSNGEAWFAIGAPDCGISEGRVHLFDRMGGRFDSIACVGDVWHFGDSLADASDLDTKAEDVWHLGDTLADAGDLDGDGVSELLISGDNTLSHARGRVWIYSPNRRLMLHAYHRGGSEVLRASPP